MQHEGVLVRRLRDGLEGERFDGARAEHDADGRPSELELPEFVTLGSALGRLRLRAELRT